MWGVAAGWRGGAGLWGRGAGRRWVGPAPIGRWEDHALRRLHEPPGSVPAEKEAEAPKVPEGADVFQCNAATVPLLLPLLCGEVRWTILS